MKVEIDVGQTKSGLYCLDINNERLLASKSLGELIDRIERELKIKFEIKDGKMDKIKRFFNK